MLKAALGNTKLAERVNMVQECLEKPEYITVFNLDTEDSLTLEEALLRALVKGKYTVETNAIH